MLEIEQKYAGADFTAIEARLRQWGAEKGAEHDEADHYFNAPDRDFAHTDEAFRLRRVGPANCLTYKGPKQAAAVKKRVELEVNLEEGAETAEKMITLLVSLGYRPVTVVRKRRRHYHLQRDGLALTICLDQVEGLKEHFAEVEVVTPSQRQQEAEALIEQTARELGLSRVERRSYLGMVLEGLAAKGEGKAPAEPKTQENAGSAGASPSPGGESCK